MSASVTLKRSEVYQILLALSHRDTQRVADAMVLLQDKLERGEVHEILCRMDQVPRLVCCGPQERQDHCVWYSTEHS